MKVFLICYLMGDNRNNWVRLRLGTSKKVKCDDRIKPTFICINRLLSFNKIKSNIIILLLELMKPISKDFAQPEKRILLNMLCPGTEKSLVQR